MYLFVSRHVYFFFFGITCTMTFQLIYWGTYTQISPKYVLPVYHHASLSSNHKDLPVSRSWPYLFIFTFILITVKIYQSMFLLEHVEHMSTCVPVHHYTCSVYFYWGSYTHIHPKINLPVYLHASLPSNHKDLLSPQLLVYLPIDYPFILITVKIYPSTFVLFYMSTDVLVFSSQCLFSLFVPFRHNIHNYLWTRIWGSCTQIHPKINWPIYPHASPLPKNKKIYSSRFSFFGITCAMTFQLIYWGTYTQIHPKINLPSCFCFV